MTACDDCLRRTALVAAVAARLDVEWRRRSAPARVLGLPDAELIELDRGGAAARAYAHFDPARARAAIRAAALHVVCRCDPAYPQRLRELADPPAVLHVLGDPAALERAPGVAIVGARRGTTYGLDVARALGRGLTRAGIPVVSGMALGVDSAAHAGALEALVGPARAGLPGSGHSALAGASPDGGRSAPAGVPPRAGSAASARALERAGDSAPSGELSSGGHAARFGELSPGGHSARFGELSSGGHSARSGELASGIRSAPSSGLASGGGEPAGAGSGDAAPIAVLAGGADVPYPRSRLRLYAALRERGAIVSELPPGFTAFRWCFVARNRLIAGLAELTVVVEATERSGSLTTADFAAQLGRPVAAVPGPVTSRFSAGANALLAAGAGVVRDTRDVLDTLLGPDAPAPRDGERGAAPDVGLPAEPRLRRLLDAIERGHGGLAELAPSAAEAPRVLQDLTELELLGLVRREFGGRYVRSPPGGAP